MNGLKVAVGLSGGVDSAVSCLLLKRQGYLVTGVHLYCWPPKSEIEKDGLTREEWIKKNGCRADEDRKAALKTALELDIPFVTLDFSEEYNRRVVDYFYREYEAGRTPNPDVLCNSEIKFGLFLDWALKNKFDYIATGHYAKLESDSLGQPAKSFSENGHVSSSPTTVAVHPSPLIQRGKMEFCLEIPKDEFKDQTYFLWKLTEKELKHVLFPLGDLEKSEVRKIAKEAELSVAIRPDSQGICFVGNVEAREFLARRLEVKKGEVKNTDGEVIGTHDGVWFYTIGQRGGWDLSSGAQKKYMSNGQTPIFYVISKEAATNELVVGEGDEALGDRFQLIEENWLRDKKEIFQVRIRHTGKLISCKVNGNEVRLTEAQRGIASGQSAVFYGKDGRVIGGGVIS